VLDIESMVRLEPTWSYNGLTSEAADIALEMHGPNITSSEQRYRWLKLFWIALANPFNFLLIVLACINAATHQLSTFVVMMAMVIASTGLRYWQEMKSTIQAVKLIKSVTTNVTVVRCRIQKDAERMESEISEEIEIDQKYVVPGDVLSVTSASFYVLDMNYKLTVCYR
jgi:P-type Mg2+ transporter